MVPLGLGLSIDSIVSSEAAIGDSTGPVKIISGTPYSSYMQLRSEYNSQDVLDNDLTVGRQYRFQGLFATDVSATYPSNIYATLHLSLIDFLYS